MRPYRFNLLLICSVLSFLCLFLYTPKEDHIGAIGLNNDKSWYMNFMRSTSTQALDRDILYHNIGNSIKNAKRADIIIVGHSMALFAIDWRLINQFSKKHNIRIFNMGSGGDTSGEFILRVIEKYNIKPAIWILNADDHERSFFTAYLSDVAKGEASDIISYNRWQAYKNTISKNIKWKTELALQRILPKTFTSLLYPDEAIVNYRSSVDGNWNNDQWPGYNMKNDTFMNKREPNCHAMPDEKELADNYIKRLKQGSVMLTLIPHALSCRTRVQELSQHLHVPFLSVGWQGMTSFDHGGHLDSAGANKFTTAFLRELEGTRAFKQLVAKRSNEADRKNQHN